jgi:hypothetical protein
MITSGLAGSHAPEVEVLRRNALARTQCRASWLHFGEHLLATERTRESFHRPGCLYLGAEEICSGPALKTIDSWSRNQPVNRLAINHVCASRYSTYAPPLLYFSRIC